ncbi:MAG: hypothetical protein ACTHM9_01255 [Gemmatimonadales bacterium]
MRRTGVRSAVAAGAAIFAQPLNPCHNLRLFHLHGHGEEILADLAPRAR